MDKFKAIRQSIQNDLNHADADAREKASLERDEYRQNAALFKEMAEAEAEDKGVSGLEVHLYGDDRTARRDILYVSYEVTERTAGKHDAIAEYLRRLTVRTRASDYFSTDVRANVHTEEETTPGDQIEIAFLRHNHTYDRLRKDPVDPVGREAEEEDDGGRRR